jgi:DNA-directed RNA polymerase specialized sigma24 family protein
MAATNWDDTTFEAHRPLLFSIAYRMLGSASEAEDVVQDAWLRDMRQSAESCGIRRHNRLQECGDYAV